MTAPSQTSSKTVLVCQNRTCRASGSIEVLAAFRAYSIPGLAVIGCGCLGQCGNGPMVLILPEETWYSRVRVDEVATIVEQDLQGGQPVRSMLESKFP